jgi:hypothetical protein
MNISAEKRTTAAKLMTHENKRLQIHEKGGIRLMFESLSSGDFDESPNIGI